MGKVEIAAIALIGLLSLSLFSYRPQTTLVNTEDLFESWMDMHGRHYDSKVERAYRHGVWVQNFEYVQSHNARFMLGEETTELAMNHFADMPNEEFVAKYLMKNVDFTKTSKCTGTAPSGDAPDDIDWTAKGAISRVKNQGQCGSCWAFSATGSLEGAYFQAKNEQQEFSEQQLMDCSTSYGNKGCGGGLMDQAFWYVIDNGITSEKKYPYKAVNSKCNYSEDDKVWGISNCADVPAKSRKGLLAAVAQQPVSVAIQANQLAFQLYRSGVLTGNCGHNLDHGVLAVGYGKDSKSGHRYWKVKNSWGSGWGEAGYIKIEDNEKDNDNGKCGINMVASFPIA